MHIGQGCRLYCFTSCNEVAAGREILPGRQDLLNAATNSCSAVKKLFRQLKNTQENSKACESLDWILVEPTLKLPRPMENPSASALQSGRIAMACAGF
jgi:hypothetical protein